ncbi:MAG: hypothetical protein RRA15_01100 [bacterium]|nr:hypothetical protein [bacterium]MDT8365074.1 hypothetical protein [bacterium]
MNHVNGSELAVTDEEIAGVRKIIGRKRVTLVTAALILIENFAAFAVNSFLPLL